MKLLVSLQNLLNKMYLLEKMTEKANFGGYICAKLRKLKIAVNFAVTYRVLL